MLSDPLDVVLWKSTRGGATTHFILGAASAVAGSHYYCLGEIAPTHELFSALVGSGSLAVPALWSRLPRTSTTSSASRQPILAEGIELTQPSPKPPAQTTVLLEESS